MFLLVSTMQIFQILPLWAVRFAMVLNLKQTVMKEFLNMMEKDYKSENFTMKEIIVFGVIAPVVILAIIGIIGWLDSIGMSGAY